MSVASSERSFSKLKTVENYLRSAVAEERLDTLMIATRSSDVLDNLDLFWKNWRILGHCWKQGESTYDLCCHLLLFLKTLLYMLNFSYAFYLTMVHPYKTSIFSYFPLESMCVSVMTHKIYRLIKIAMRYSFDLSDESKRHLVTSEICWHIR